MKRLLIALLALAGIAVLAPAPASAYIDDPMINGRKFATTAVCVGSTLDQSVYRVGYIAQTVNVATEEMALDYSTNCAADGYTPSKRMVIGTFSGPGLTSCLVFQNMENSWFNGFYRWTNGPGFYINTALSNCVSTQTRRDHWVSQGMIWILGLNTLNSAGWNSHVMNITAWSRDNVGTLHYSEGIKLDEVYRGTFCDIGVVC